MPFDIAAEIRSQPKPPVLVRGTVSWNVKLLRRALGAAGFGPPFWANLDRQVSDVFDAGLEEVVQAFQRASGVQADGVIGHDTWLMLADAVEVAVENVEPPSAGEGLAHGDGAALRARIIELAKAAEHRHIRETGGSNRGPTVELILKHAGGEPGWAWCVAFCWAVIDLTCFTLDLDPPAMDKLSCSRLVAWAEEHGRLVTEPGEALPGDLLVLAGGDTGYRHVGIIVGDPDNHGRFPTIEGNTNPRGSAEGDGIYAKLRDPQKTPCVFVRVN